MAGYSVTYSVVDDATAKITAINKQIAALRAPIERQQKALMQFVNVSGLQKVADGFKGIAGAAAEAFSSLARLVPVIGGLTGAATVGGLIALVKSFTDLGTQLERDADYLGTSTRHFAAMAKRREARRGQRRRPHREHEGAGPHERGRLHRKEHRGPRTLWSSGDRA